MRDLLPCPFCGHVEIALGCKDDTFYFYCCKCCIEGPWLDTIQKAKEFWNRRWTP